MSIACPHCRAVMTPKGLKPGSTYSPKCLKCGKEFSIVVPVDPLGTLKVGEVEPPKIPDNRRTPSVKPTGSAKKPEQLPDTVKVPPVKPKGGQDSESQ